METLFNKSTEEISLTCFEDFEKQNYPLRLAFYKDNKYFYKGKFSSLTNGIGETRTFRAFINDFIKNFTPELISKENNLWLSLKENGEFVVIMGSTGEIIKDLTPKDFVVYNLLCFLNLVRFWDEFNEIRDINIIKLPLVIKLPDYFDFDLNLQFLFDMVKIADREVFISKQ